MEVNIWCCLYEDMVQSQRWASILDFSNVADTRYLTLLFVLNRVIQIFG
jgi:hypothetical protein